MAFVADSAHHQDSALYPFIGQLERAAGFTRDDTNATKLDKLEALRSGTTPLVGRDEELDLLTRRWQQAKQGEGRVVLVSGEPGIGKSRLTAARCRHISRVSRTPGFAIFARRTIRTARSTPLSASWNAPRGSLAMTRTHQSSTSWKRCSATRRNRVTSR